jgi:hypothetical protein
LANKGAKLGEKLGGAKQLEEVNKKLSWTKLGARHAERLTHQQNSLASSVRAGEKVGEQLGHHSVEAVQKSKNAKRPEEVPQ